MRILSATDLLPKSEAAIERAGLLADSLKGELTLVHAVPVALPDGQTLEERVRRASSHLAARVSPPDWRWESRPEIAVQCGQAARVVLDNVHRQNTQLVVLGPHRRSALADAVNGTTLEKVLGVATCPLLIAQGEMQGFYRRVVVALDGSPNAAKVVRAFESLGLAHRASATVVHAHEPPYAGMMTTVGVGLDATTAYVDASRAQAAAGIRELLNANSADAHRYQIVIVERRPAPAISDAVERLKPDLVVLGTRGHGRFRRALLGSVASEVLRAAQCDVLLVPERAARTRRASEQPAAAGQGDRCSVRSA